MIQYQFSDCIARIHVASRKFVKSVSITYSVYILQFISLLHKEGFIEGFRVYKNSILVFLKYNLIHGKFLLRTMKVISTPGRRQYWNLRKLNRNYSYRNFSGVYFISSIRGIITSADALLKFRCGGEILLKIVI